MGVFSGDDIRKNRDPCPQLSQLDCENPEVRNRKGAQSGLDTPKIVMTIREPAVLKRMEMGLREKIPY